MKEKGSHRVETAVDLNPIKPVGRSMTDNAAKLLLNSYSFSDVSGKRQQWPVEISNPTDFFPLLHFNGSAQRVSKFSFIQRNRRYNTMFINLTRFSN